jgi:hypothetical protein
MTAFRAHVAFLAFAIIALFFSNASLYGFESGLVAVRPFWWAVALAALSLPLVVRYVYSLKLPVAPLIGWTIFYLIISLAWFAAYPVTEASQEELRRRVLAIGFIGITWLTFTHPGVLRATRWMLLFVTLLSASLNVVEFFRPSLFSIVAGRAAGLYLNPNVSGAALILGMLLCVRLLGPWARVLFILIVGVGVAATFSRAATLGWLLIAASLLVPEAKRLGFVRLASAIVVSVFATGGLVTVVMQNSDTGALLAHVVEDRIGGLGGERPEDTSVRERRELLNYAVDAVTRHPLSGSGLGSNHFLDHETGLHNQYLNDAVQHGLIGLAILPLLALSLVFGSHGTARTDAIRFALFVLFWGMFSHNVLDELYLWTAIVIQAAIGREGAFDEQPFA